MNFPKKRRVINKMLLESYHNKFCCICGSTIGIVGHHVKSKGSGGDDEEGNILALCFKHHREVHDKGAKTFKKKYNV
jgi:predicted restriction endonuclease